MRKIKPAIARLVCVTRAWTFAYGTVHGMIVTRLHVSCTLARSSTFARSCTLARCCTRSHIAQSRTSCTSQYILYTYPAPTDGAHLNNSHTTVLPETRTQHRSRASQGLHSRTYLHIWRTTPMHGLCTKCSKHIPTGLARHHRLAHSTCSTCRWQGLQKDFLERSPCSQRAGTPVEELACESEVLRVLGIKEVDLPWPLEALDALPNGRMHHNFSQFGSSKGGVPHILDTGQHGTLPLGIDLVWKLTEVLKSDEDVTVSVIQEDDAQALTTGNCRVCSSAMMSATRIPWMHYRPSVSSWTSLQAATTVRLLKDGSMFRWDLS